MNREITQRSAMAKAIDNNLQKNTHPDYNFCSHLFDSLFQGRLDSYFAQPEAYRGVDVEDVQDYIQYRITNDQSLVRNEDMIVHDPSQYLTGFLGKLWQKAGDIAKTALTPKNVEVEAPA
jgi:hypothetical protein